MAKNPVIKVSVINDKLERLRDKAAIAEIVAAGSSLKFLPTESEARQLLALAREIAKFRRRACQLAARKTGGPAARDSRRGKQAITFRPNPALLDLNARTVNGSFRPKGFRELAGLSGK